MPIEFKTPRNARSLASINYLGHAHAKGEKWSVILGIVDDQGTEVARVTLEVIKIKNGSQAQVLDTAGTFPSATVVKKPKGYEDFSEAFDAAIGDSEARCEAALMALGMISSDLTPEIKPAR